MKSLDAALERYATLYAEATRDPQRAAGLAATLPLAERAALNARLTADADLCRAFYTRVEALRTRDPMVELEQHAIVSAELAGAPAAQDAVLARVGLDRTTWGELDRRVRATVAAEPKAYAKWSATYRFAQSHGKKRVCNETMIGSAAAPASMRAPFRIAEPGESIAPSAAIPGAPWSNVPAAEIDGDAMGNSTLIKKSEIAAAEQASPKTAEAPSSRSGVREIATAARAEDPWAKPAANESAAQVAKSTPPPATRAPRANVKGNLYGRFAAR